MSNETPLAYSVTEGCKKLDISRSLGYLLMDRGELGFIKVGKRRLIPHTALVDFIERKQQEQEVTQ